MVSKQFLLSLTLGLAPCAANELYDVVQTCELPAVKQMIASGGLVNDMNVALDTPLHVAVRAGKPECVYLLLAAGANPFPPNRAGATPHLLARQYPAGAIHDQMLFLFERPALLKQPLTYAITRGDANITRLLLDVGLDPNAAGADGSTPLHHAALTGKVPALEVLLAHGATTEAFDRDGFLPLHLAALAGKAAAVTALLAGGAKMSAVTRDSGESALHLAAAWGRIEAVQVLLASGANNSAKDKKGRTPLDRAAENHFDEIVSALKVSK
jgi:ankyrin repeat protein